MRESIGATWVLSICLTFIVLFTAYLAISINYAKAFKTKDYIISMIEENEGIGTNNVDSFNEKVNNFLFFQGYDAKKMCSAEGLRDDNADFGGNTWAPVTLINNGVADGSGRSYYCVYRRSASVNPDCDNQSVYKVVTFFKFDLPVLNSLLVFEVTGNSKVIHDFSNRDCY